MKICNSINKFLMKDIFINFDNKEDLIEFIIKLEKKNIKWCSGECANNERIINKMWNKYSEVYLTYAYNDVFSKLSYGAADNRGTAIKYKKFKNLSIKSIY